MSDSLETKKSGVFSSWQKVDADILKVISMISMVVDHTAAVFLPLVGMENSFLYFIGRFVIGRIAFPIFAFLIVEGFVHTRSRAKYLRNILIFAIVSEIPYKMCFGSSQHNTLFSFALSFCVMWTLDTLREKSNPANIIGNATCILAGIALVIVACAGAMFFSIDYSYSGILLVLIFYLYRQSRIFGGIAGYAVLAKANIAEIFSLPAFVLLLFYNGKRGKTRSPKQKYFYYIFYPSHLIIIAVISGFLF